MPITNFTASVAAPSTPSLVKRINLSRYVGEVFPGSCAVRGTEITDANRVSPTQGDGRAAPDSSYGIWDAATNLVTNGGFESGTSIWVAAQTGVTFSSSTAQAKFGTHSAAVVCDGTAVQQGIRTSVAAVAVSASTVYTASVWVNAPANTPITLYWQEYNGASYVQNGANQKSIIASGGWDRLIITNTTSGTTTNVIPFVIVTNPNLFTGTFYVDGAQVEQRAFATPYIETNGATATRAGAGVSAPAYCLSPAQGWVAMGVRAGQTAATNAKSMIPFDWRNPTNTDSITLGQNGAGSNNQWNLQYRQNSVNAFASQTTTIVVGDIVVFVFKWIAGSTIGLSIKGAAFTNTATAMSAGGFASTAIGIGWLPQNSATGNNDYFWCAMGLGALTDADAATINGWGSTDPTWAQLTALNSGNAKPTFLWTADTAAYYAPGLTMTKQASLIRSITRASTTTLTKTTNLVRTVTEASTPTLQKLVRLSRIAAATSAPTIAKTVNWSRSLAAGSAATTAKTIGKIASVGVASTTGIGKIIAQGITATAGTFAANPGKLISQGIRVTVPTVAVISKQIGMSVAVAATNTARTTKVVALSVRASVGSVLSWLRQFIPHIPGRLTISDYPEWRVTVNDYAEARVTISDKDGAV